MIYWFSGTGNSHWVAQQLARQVGEPLADVAQLAKEGRFTHAAGPEEKIGFVFPVYAWNPPRMVLEWIQNMQWQGYSGQYTFAVCTCGDDTGRTMAVLRKALNKKGMALHSGWALAMPNNYVLGFDVDPPKEEAQKLAAAQQALPAIALAVQQQKKDIWQDIPGSAAFAKTCFAGWAFNTFARSTAPFYANSNCVSCGLCEKICPTGSIALQAGKPVWSGKCAQCLGCLHRCPAKAIQYGKQTEAKGRYYNPLLEQTEASVL